MYPFNYNWEDPDEEHEELGETKKKSGNCIHVWEKTGQSLLMKEGEYWYNCKKCGIPKEKA